MHTGYLRLQTLTICNTYHFSAVTMVALTRLIVTFCVHCLSCLILPTFCKQSRVSKLKLAGGDGEEAVVTRSVPVGMYR
jgi:hypothetical protein